MREKYIDIAKGIGIWCIVLLHYENGIFPSWLNSFIGNFMITIFYITSGWTMAINHKKISTKDLFHKRLRTLGKPYIYWSIIILLFDILLYLFSYYDSFFLIRETYKTITLRGIGTLWFLPALFGGELLWNWAKGQSRLIIISFFILSFFYLFVYYRITNNIPSAVFKILEAPFHTIANVVNAFLGVSVGFLFSEKVFIRNIENKKSLFRWFLFLLVSGCLLLKCNPSYMEVNIVIEIVRSICLPISLLILCYFIRTSTFFEYWGRNSLSLMVTHYSIVMVVLMIINEKVFGLQSTPKFIGPDSIFYFFISIPFQFLITELINSKFPYLFSKQR